MNRLLFVDDNPFLSNFTVQAISRRFPDLEVVHTDTYFDALELVKRLSPDLVVTDIQLPDGDGVALIEQVRLLAPESRIVVMSADTALLESVGQVPHVVGILGKPCPIEYLLMAIEEVLHSSPENAGAEAGHGEFLKRIYGRRPERSAGDDLVRMLAEIRKDGLRMREMVQEMLRFSCRMDESVMQLSSMVDRMIPGADETAGGTVIHRR